METTSLKKTKVGSYTLALGLIALGTGLLAHNFNLIPAPSVLRLWPLLLIGLGAEYFIRKITNRGDEIQFSIPSVVLIGLIIVAAVAVNALYNLGPVRFPDDFALNCLFDHTVQYSGEWRRGMGFGSNSPTDCFFPV